MTTDQALRDAIEQHLDKHARGVLPIVAVGHPVLRLAAARYDGQLGDLLPVLLESMRLTMLEAPGVGLAAPQIGISLALAVMQDPGVGDAEQADPRERTPLDYRVLVNPDYAPVGPDRRSFYEGCLSVPGYQAVVPRHRSVRLTATDDTGATVDEVLTGWPARIVQHETDHLRGELYIDHAHTRSLATNENLARYWSDTPDPSMAAQVMGFPLS
ncbi:peptide deformylase [Sanguibacter antarcticus]|uniref:Peptide deformylase n=1 Tax=Sanguibacter antarcticus TaxID=372484 RepID=A0A2A9E551_9MICO|nr:peptide deformylase [Sanguibacter antarcticus]PFG33984.1 peptide deformylase [Sanguibacter antarcticus]